MRLRNTCVIAVGVFVFNVAAMSLPASAQMTLVKDIDHGDGSWPANIVEAGGVTFFSAQNPAAGTELWRTDGTDAGTVLVKDIQPGPTGSNPSQLLEFGGKVFFQADDGVNGRELWTSDGTEAGTQMVIDIAPSGSSSPGGFVPYGSVFLFGAHTDTNGSELWRSDGTASGTVMVADNHPSGDHSPSHFFVAPDAVYYRGTDPTHGSELWKTDGTAAGTVLVKDIDAGTGSSYPGGFAQVGNAIVFAAIHPTWGKELWVTDGTDAGTTLVLDIYPGPSNHSYPSTPVSIAGIAYFSARDATSGEELWRTDGTSAGTYMVADLYPGPTSSGPAYLTEMDDSLYFSAYLETHGEELCRSDGTAVGTSMVADILPGGASSNISGMVALASQILFSADDGTTDKELWRSDGTVAGTVQVMDINPFWHSLPGGFAHIGAVVYFAADDGTHGFELWRTDGTTPGTSMVSDVGWGGSAYPSALATDGTTLQFFASDKAHGEELWASDGTEAGTAIVKDIIPGPDSGGTGYDIVNAGPRAFFEAATPEAFEELWASDGTEAGTHLVRDIYPGAYSSDVRHITPLDVRVVFSATDGIHGAELWVSDGTEAGTTMAKDIRSSSTGSSPDNFCSAGSAVYFVADDGVAGSELWITDGTSAGTSMVKDIDPVPNVGSMPRKLRFCGGRLYFEASSGAPIHGEPWVSDGTESGTVLLKDIRPSGSSYPQGFTEFAGNVFFSADDGVHGQELWKTDGTTTGTVLLKDLNPSGDGVPESFCVAGGALYFLAHHTPGSTELWRTDGTETGTTMVTAGPVWCYGAELVAVDGLLCFAASDGVLGVELWTSTGEAQGTTLYQDLQVGPGTSLPTNLIAMGGNLYLCANDGYHGTELWSAPLPPQVVRIECSDPSPTNASVVGFTVVVTEDVNGIDASDFAATQVSGTVTGVVSSVAPSGPAATYTVTVDVTGEGTLRLDLIDGDSVTDQQGEPLGGAGAQDFVDGESYVIAASWPSPPVVTGPTVISDDTPTWTWTSGGGGNAYYRYGFAEGVWIAIDVTDTAYTAGTLADGAHRLYVQERDSAGTWSASGSHIIEVDTLPPIAPTVAGATPTSDTTPTWSWTLNGGAGYVRYGYVEGVWVGDDVADVAFTPPSSLSDGIHTLYVQERDAVGNWSASGIRAIEVDTTPPSSPLVAGATPTNDVTPLWTWTWTSGSSGSRRCRYGLVEGTWIEEDVMRDSYAPSSPLAEGSHTLYVQECDALGNWSSSGTHTITVDTTPPSAPTVTGTTPTNDTTPTWSWSSGGGGGNARFRYGFAEGTWIAEDVSDVDFTPVSGLGSGTHSLFVQEVDDAGNWSPSGSFEITIDVNGPSPPTVNGPDATFQTMPTWTWTPGSGGSGFYRYGYAEGSWIASDVVDVSYSPATNLSEGAHVLYVQERDEFGNWSDSGAHTIVVDTTPPSAPALSAVTPTNDNTPTWTWVSGGGGSGRFRYGFTDGVWIASDVLDLNYTPIAPLADGTHTLYVQEHDEAGNWSASGFAIVAIDTIAPPPPAVSAPSTTTDATPTWSWSSAGGNGTYRYGYSDGSWLAVDVSDTTFTPGSDLAAGTHTLFVQERDDAGNWSASSSAAVEIIDIAPVPQLRDNGCGAGGAQHLVVLILVGSALAMSRRKRLLPP